MKHLRENGYITVNDEGHIKLTPSGLAIAAKIYERHTVISEILESMGVNPKVAAEDACRVEHVISTESFDAIKKYIKDHRLL
jgi:Mn-dependent DtxR family transcriptional regulator